MASITAAVSDFMQNLVAFVFMIVLSIISFFFTVFVVDVGAGFAGHGGNEYVVLSAALLVAAAIIAGGISPLGFLSQTNQIEASDRTQTTSTDDRA